MLLNFWFKGQWTFWILLPRFFRSTSTRNFIELSTFISRLAASRIPFTKQPLNERTHRKLLQNKKLDWIKELTNYNETVAGQQKNAFFVPLLLQLFCYYRILVFGWEEKSHGSTVFTLHFLEECSLNCIFCYLSFEAGESEKMETKKPKHTTRKAKEWSGQIEEEGEKC